MINWNAVTVGETKLCKGDKLMLVLAMDLPWIWCKYMLEYKTFHKDRFHDWTIYDPWEDVSHQCTINRASEVNDVFICWHGAAISKTDERFRYGPGLRVWKRKEG